MLHATFRPGNAVQLSVMQECPAVPKQGSGALLTDSSPDRFQP